MDHSTNTDASDQFNYQKEYEAIDQYPTDESADNKKIYVWK